MDFAFHCSRLFSSLGSSKKMVLSTCENNFVTSRMMSIVIENQTLYFQTDKTMLKYSQLKQNPNAALCADNLSLHGICKELGKAAEFDRFCRLYSKHFPSSFQRYTMLENERLFAFYPTKAQLWIYENNQPLIETFDFIQKQYCKQPYLIP